MEAEHTEHENLRDLGDLDRLVHEPARLMVMMYLYNVESADYVFLVNVTGLTWGNLSSHLSKLEEAGYVNIEKTYKGKLPLTVCKLTEAGRRLAVGHRSRSRDTAKAASA